MARLGFHARCLAGALLGVSLSSPAQGQVPSATQLQTDGTLPGGVATLIDDIDGNHVYEIPHTLGSFSGPNLFHSFSRFDIASGDTASFSATQPFDRVIARVTGGFASQIDGTLASAIENADFFLLNPEGVFFGPASRIDVPASFHLSGADLLHFSDGEEWSSGSASPSLLSGSAPEAYGFLDRSVGTIEVFGGLEVQTGYNMSLVGGEIRIDGREGQGVVSAPDGDIYLISLASPGTVFSGPFADGAPVLTGFEALGEISLENDAVVSSSGISPFFSTPSYLNGPFADCASNCFAAVRTAGDPSSVPSGAILVMDGTVNGLRQVKYFAHEVPPPLVSPRDYQSFAARGAGDVWLRGLDLMIRDSEIRAVTPGADSGRINVALTGDLQVEASGGAADVGILGRSGLIVQQRDEAGNPIDGRVLVAEIGSLGCAAAVTASCRVVPIGEPPAVLLELSDPRLFLDFTRGAGTGAEIAIQASNLSLTGGGILSTSSLSRGSAGNISIQADSITVAGRSSSSARPSGIFSNNQGSSAVSGNIEIGAHELSLIDGGGLFTQTTANGNAGNIHVRVARLRILDDSQVDSSTSAQSLGAGDPGPTTGVGGNLQIEALESLTISGRRDAENFARLSTFSKARSRGSAGMISVQTPLLQVENGGGIAVTTSGSGQGGGISIKSDRVLLTDASISARSDASGDAGRIELNVADSLRMERSEVTARSESGFGGSIAINGDSIGEGAAGSLIAVKRDGQVAGQSVTLIDSAITTSVGKGEGDGGNVLIDPAVVVLDESTISATARGGDGGDILIVADAIIASRPLGELLKASSETGVSGRVQTSSPGVDLEGQVKPPPVSLLDASSMLLAECSARRSGDQAGSFQVARWPGLPLPEHGPLIAFESLEASPAVTAGGQAGAPEVSRAAADSARAGAFLEEAVGAARRSEDAVVLSIELNHLGNHHAIGRRFGAALSAYTESAAAADSGDDALRSAQADANAARVALERSDLAAALQLITRAKNRSRGLGDNAEGIQLWIHLADSYARLALLDARFREEGLRLGHGLLLGASDAAVAFSDARLQSDAWGRLAGLYEQEGGRDAEALYLTSRALRAAEQAQAAELLVRWHVQAGRIQWAVGNGDAAVASYQRAVEILDETRPELRARSGAPERFFEQSIAPAYLALVEALLAQSAGAETATTVQEYLSAARGTFERFKVAELRDYFQDECVEALEAQARPLESLSAHAAVVYPILLRDRLELLVSRPQGIERYSVAVRPEELAEVAHRFQAKLVQRSTRAYREPAQQLYTWLLRPFANTLAAEGVDTLVIIPSGPLLAIPWAALHDGDRFVIERFAVAVTPSLNLIAPKPLEPTGTRLLLAGLSEAVQGYPGIDGVQTELAAVRDLYGGELLLDAEFRTDRLEEELRERPPGVVHIASHAEFTGDPRTSFVLTHDERLTMDRLATLVSSRRFGKEPLELLLLSACETASGDDRAALGLAGIAVRAGARSAMGSLWMVNDQATSELIVGFYRELGQPAVSKAQALARAQRALLAGHRFDHPFYWAGFLVINNWL